MTNCKTILIYIAGMATIITILVGKDLYDRKMDTLCFNQQAPVEEFKPIQ